MEDSRPSGNLLPLQQQLSDLLAHIYETDSEQSWQDVERVSRTLADGLRVRDDPGDNHTILGRTMLPRSLTSLFTLSLHDSAIPGEKYSSVVIEILRLAANFCMDHDENRGYLLEAGFPQALVSLLEGYTELIPSPPHAKPFQFSISHLKIIRTAIGVLLNASIGYDAVKSRLRSLEAATTILKLSTSIYPPGSWSDRSVYRTDFHEAISNEDAWIIRCSLSNWAWRTISELKDTQDETLQIFTPDVLPLLVPPLLAFSPPYATESDALFGPGSTVIPVLINADLEVLQESCMLIESLSLDAEDIRLSLARGLHFPAEHSGIPCLSTILDFIESGAYPPAWNLPVIDDADRRRKEKSFDMCKAALIKSVVEVAGEGRNADVLWDDSEPEKPGGEFVDRMAKWLRRYVDSMNAPAQDPQRDSIIDRDDMVICASLALGNLARREKNSIALLSPPYDLAPILASQHFLSPSTDINVKHGVLGLLKHLAQAPPRAHAIHSALGQARIIQRIVASGVWDDKAGTMADIVQLSAIGVAKHMCSANVEHTYALVLPLDQSPTTPTGLSQILGLIKRSDSVPIKSEGSRVLVNVVKSLWSNNSTAPPTASSLESPIVAGRANRNDILDKQSKRSKAIHAVLTAECARILASLVGRSGKYPLLVNEGIVGLSLLSIKKEGGSLVLAAIMTPLLPDTPAPLTEPGSAVKGSDSDSPSDRPRLPVPRHALDMLVFILKNVDNPANFPIEVRVNVCSLLLQLSKHTSGEELTRVKETAKPVLEGLLESVKEEILERAIQRVLDSWS